MNEYSIKLSVDELNYVMSLLRSSLLRWEDTNPVIQKIIVQVAQQNSDTPTATAVPETEPAVG